MTCEIFWASFPPHNLKVTALVTCDTNVVPCRLYVYICLPYILLLYSISYKCYAAM